MTLRLGPLCQIRRAEIAWPLALMALRDAAVEVGYVAQLTHGDDGIHSWKSHHYPGRPGAVDFLLISRDGAVADDDTHMDVCARVRGDLRGYSQDFDCHYENGGTPNRHGHLEFDPKGPIRTERPKGFPEPRRT